MCVSDEKRQQIDGVRKQMNENELLREKEERMRKELEVDYVVLLSILN